MRDGLQELEENEQVFRALAHSSRRQILLVLQIRGGTMRAGELARRFACSWPTTTRHLRVLQDAGLVRVERDGRERLYSLDAKTLQRVLGGWVRHFNKQDEESSE